MKGKAKGCSECGKMKCACGGQVKKMKAGGGVKTRGCGAATKGTMARGPMA